MDLVGREKYRRTKRLNEDKIIEYILVNKELNMGVGKIAGQVAHVQTLIDNEVKFYADHHHSSKLPPAPEEWVQRLEWYEEWFLLDRAQTKVILRAKEKDLRKAIEMGAFFIRDNGLTEIPAGSLTVVGFLPQPKSNLVSFTKKFQLL